MAPITDNDVYEYACCPTKFYLNRSEEIIGNDESLYLSHIAKIIEKNRDEICKSLNPTKVSGDENSIFSETNKIMKNGESHIEGAVLFANGLLAKPFLLERINKSSRLGKHSYQVVDFVPSIQFSDEYKKKLAYQSYLLYFYLGFMPNNCKMINLKKEIIEFNPIPIFTEVSSIINDINRINSIKEKPSPSINAHCKICKWREKCVKECIETKDTSLLFGVSKDKKNMLAIEGIKNILDVVKLNDNFITKLKSSGLKNISFLIKQANTFLTGKVEFIETPKFPKRNNALYFDVEGQIDLDFQYLFGIYNETTEEYVPFWANTINDEKEAFLQFLNYLSKIGKCTLFHYGTYEKKVIKDLFFKYNLPTVKEEAVLKSMVDIYSIVKKSVALPIYSYSLKDVAGQIGFKWRDNDALGVNSIIWHNNWLDTKNMNSKNRILQYNEDDCKATKHVKEWLERKGE